MKVQHYRDVGPLSMEDAKDATQGLTVRRVISNVDGAADSTTDVSIIAPGGFSARHAHPWEHQVFAVAGKGAVTDGRESTPFRGREVIVIPADEPHQFVNDGDSDVLFVCLIPKAALAAHQPQRAGQPTSTE